MEAHPLGWLTAAVYDLVTAGVERQVFGERRRRPLEAARGRVLEVGAGTGASLPHYPRANVEAAGFAFESLEELRERRIRVPIVQPQLIGTARPAGRT